MKYLINNLSTNWSKFISDEMNKDYLIKIDEFLFNQSSIIYPEKNNIFKAFDFFNIEETKIIIFGQDPYHNPNQANGLSFSVNQAVKIPPSLKNIFKKLKLELDVSRTNPDLSDWAKQGVLLLNTILTVEKNKPMSHSKIGWDIFILNVIEKLNNCNQKLLFVLMGKNAASLNKYIDHNKHSAIITCHPSPLSANSCGFFDQDLFKKINAFIKKNYNKEFFW